MTQDWIIALLIIVVFAQGLVILKNHDKIKVPDNFVFLADNGTSLDEQNPHGTWCFVNDAGGITAYHGYRQDLKP